MPGSTLAGSPPSRATASRIAARSAIAGTPVRSCISTRAGMNCSSRWPASCAARLRSAMARMSSAVTSTPSSRRKQVLDAGRAANTAGVRGSPTIESSRKMSYERSPTERRERAPKLSRVTRVEATLRPLRSDHDHGRRHRGRRRRHEARGRRRARRRHARARGSTRPTPLDVDADALFATLAGLVDRLDASRRGRGRRRAAAARWTAAASTSRRSTSPRGAASRCARGSRRTPRLPGVGRQRRQGARARRRLDRRGASARATTSRWSCRPASAAASSSTAGCSTAPTATPATSAT